jgi:hypothetical protein
MLDAIELAVVAATYAFAALALACVIASAARRWELVRRLSKATLLGATATILVLVVLALGGFHLIAGADASAKATFLAKGVSELLNCGAFLVIATLIAAPCFVIARRQLRRTASIAGDRDRRPRER